MSEPSRDDLITWLMHDLRAPLTGIQVMAEALEDGLAPDPQAHFRQIQQEVRRMSSMVDDLVDLARARALLAMSAPRPSSLSAVLESALSSTRPVAAAYGVVLTGEESCPAAVEVDPEGLARVLRNLLLNGIRHTPVGGSVTVATSTFGGRVEISVLDGCGGMSPEVHAHAFEPAWRGRERDSGPGRATLDAGAGLGLTIVRAIVEAHRGAVSVDNHEDGCRFRVCLPASA